MTTYTILSGKGGVGKSMLSANLAVTLAELGQRVLLVDADFGLANLDVLLGVAPERNLYHVLTGQAKLSDAITDAPAGVMFLAGGSAVPLLNSIGPKRVERLFDEIAALPTPPQTVIFDAGAGIAPRVMLLAGRTDHSLLVATPEPTSMVDAYAAVKTLWRSSPDAAVHVLANQVESEKQGSEVAAALAQIADNFLQRPLGYLGCVRKDPHAAAWLVKRRPFALGAPHTPAATDVRSLAKLMVLGLPKPGDAGFRAA